MSYLRNTGHNKTASLSSRRPSDETGNAYNQSAEWAACDASRWARSCWFWAPSSKFFFTSSVQAASQFRYMCAAVPSGRLDWEQNCQVTSDDWTDKSGWWRWSMEECVSCPQPMPVRLMVSARRSLRILRPPSFTGSDAWLHWLSDISTFKMADRPFRKVSSNSTNDVFNWQSELRDAEAVPK